MKNLITKIFSVVILSLSTSAYADEVKILSKEDHEVRLLKTIKLKDNQYAYLTVRNNGHVSGQKFVIQTRVSCNGPVEDFSALNVVDSHSVCNIQPESVTVNKKLTAIAMYTRSANHEKFTEDLSKGLNPSEPSCNESTETLKFSLKGMCPDS